MEIMSAPFSRFYRIVALTFCLILVQILAATAGQLALNNVARVSVGARVDDKIAEAALISGQPGVGYALLDGQTELVLSLSKIENIDIVSFFRSSAHNGLPLGIFNQRDPPMIAVGLFFANSIPASVGLSELVSNDPKNLCVVDCAV